MWELDYKGSWVPKNWCFSTVLLEKTLESPLDCKEIEPVKSVLNIHWKDWCWSWNCNTLATWWEVNSLEKTLIDAGKDWRQEKGMTEDEIVGWHHWHNGHGFQQAMGVGDGQGGLECHSPWGRKELHMTEWLNWTEETKWLAFLSPLCEESRKRIPTMLTEKNTHLKKVRSYVLFGDLTEDYSLGVNLSDSSEELFQRGKGGNQGEGRGRHVKKKIKELLLITKNRYLKWTILVPFCVWEDLRLWAHWNYSSEMHLN